MSHANKIFEEMILGGLSGGFACIFTNPLEVVKTRLQLQGELKSKGTYAVHYKNFVHAFYTIGKLDGLLALQSGLLTGVLYQFTMNGARLGCYQFLSDFKLHMNSNGSVSYPKAFLMGGFSGSLGAFLGSPLYLVKTHFQAHSESQIAVGFQRERMGLLMALSRIYNDKGFIGLWRGWQAQVVRVMAGSSVQLATFSKCKNLLHNYQIADINNISNSILASCASAITVTMSMSPFDVLSTRIYNQPLDEFGKGKYYSGIFDAFTKVLKKEGFFGLYKGASGVFMRLSPHTVITLVTWDKLRQTYVRLVNRDSVN